MFDERTLRVDHTQAVMLSVRLCYFQVPLSFVPFRLLPCQSPSLMAAFAPRPLALQDGGFTAVFGAHLDAHALQSDLSSVHDEVLVGMIRGYVRASGQGASDNMPTLRLHSLCGTITAAGPTAFPLAIGAATFRGLSFNLFYARLDCSGVTLASPAEVDSFFSALAPTLAYNVTLCEIMFPVMTVPASLAQWAAVAAALQANPRPLLSSWSLARTKLSDEGWHVLLHGIVNAAKYLPPALLDLTDTLVTAGGLHSYVASMQAAGPAPFCRLQAVRLNGVELWGMTRGDAIPALIALCEGLSLGN